MFQMTDDTIKSKMVMDIKKKSGNALLGETVTNEILVRRYAFALYQTYLTSQDDDDDDDDDDDEMGCASGAQKPVTTETTNAFASMFGFS